MSDNNKSKVIDAYPLSKMQMGMYFHYITEPEKFLYHDVFNLELATTWCASAMEKAIEETLQGHPALRTAFEFEKFSQPLQLVHDKGVVRLTCETIPDDGQDAEHFITQRIEQLEQQPFDLHAPSQIRFTVLLRNEREFQLLVDAHHMILDGWSMASLLTELFQRYLNHTGIADFQVQPQPTVAFKDFIKL